MTNIISFPLKQKPATPAAKESLGTKESVIDIDNFSANQIIKYLTNKKTMTVIIHGDARPVLQLTHPLDLTFSGYESGDDTYITLSNIPHYQLSKAIIMAAWHLGAWDVLYIPRIRRWLFKPLSLWPDTSVKNAWKNKDFSLNDNLRRKFLEFKDIKWIKTRSDGGYVYQLGGEKETTYLAVPYTKRNHAKKHGARWNKNIKSWYIIGQVPKALERYINDEWDEMMQQGVQYGE